MNEPRFEDGAGRDAQEATDVEQMHAPIQNERAEPVDGYEPAPTAWIMLALGLCIWSGWYLGRFGAEFSSTAYDGDAPQVPGAVASINAVVQDPLKVGRRVFNNCMACHQQDGQGLVGQYPPLAGSEWVLGEPQILAKILLQGMDGAVQVKGATYNGIMPAWPQLDNEQIAAVLSYVRTSWGNEATPVAAELIETERQATRERSGAWTAQELKR